MYKYFRKYQKLQHPGNISHHTMVCWKPGQSARARGRACYPALPCTCAGPPSALTQMRAVHTLLHHTLVQFQVLNKAFRSYIDASSYITVGTPRSEEVPPTRS